MKISRVDAINGFIDFVQSEVIKNVPDTTMKIILGTLVFSIKNKPAIVDSYLADHKIIESMLFDCDGYFDTDQLLVALSNSVRDYGNVTITVPSIPLISKDEKKLSFCYSDIETLRRYIERRVGMEA